MLIWTYIHSRLDENNESTIYIYEILVKYKVAKSTMKRIVNYGYSFYGDNMVFKWFSNHLQISLLDNVGGRVVEKKRVSVKKKKVSKKNEIKLPVKPSNVYSKMIEMYDVFCEDKTGVGCKIDGMQGKSMKSIISYLKSQCKKKNSSLKDGDLDSAVLQSWTYILGNWKKLDDYNRGRIKLNEINSNMVNILLKIKEQPINKKQKERNEQITKAIHGAQSTDYSRLGK
tara:strand:- start:68 stop:751 length:684 start_codon:yes stop_codon:yes gene_type:complete